METKGMISTCQFSALNYHRLISCFADRLVENLQNPEIRDRILYETSDRWKIDLSKKPSDIPAESFRKINID